MKHALKYKYPKSFRMFILYFFILNISRVGLEEVGCDEKCKRALLKDSLVELKEIVESGSYDNSVRKEYERLVENLDLSGDVDVVMKAECQNQQYPKKESYNVPIKDPLSCIKNTDMKISSPNQISPLNQISQLFNPQAILPLANKVNSQLCSSITTNTSYYVSSPVFLTESTASKSVIYVTQPPKIVYVTSIITSSMVVPAVITKTASTTVVPIVPSLVKPLIKTLIPQILVPTSSKKTENIKNVLYTSIANCPENAEKITIQKRVPPPVIQCSIIPKKVPIIQSQQQIYNKQEPITQRTSSQQQQTIQHQIPIQNGYYNSMAYPLSPYNTQNNVNTFQNQVNISPKATYNPYTQNYLQNQNNISNRGFNQYEYCSSEKYLNGLKNDIKNMFSELIKNESFKKPERIYIHDQPNTMILTSTLVSIVTSIQQIPTPPSVVTQTIVQVKPIYDSRNENFYHRMISQQGNEVNRLSLQLKKIYDLIRSGVNFKKSANNSIDTKNYRTVVSKAICKDDPKNICKEKPSVDNEKQKLKNNTKNVVSHNESEKTILNSSENEVKEKNSKNFDKDDLNRDFGKRENVENEIKTAENSSKVNMTVNQENKLPKNLENEKLEKKNDEKNNKDKPEKNYDENEAKQHNQKSVNKSTIKKSNEEEELSDSSVVRNVNIKNFKNESDKNESLSIENFTEIESKNKVETNKNKPSVKTENILDKDDDYTESAVSNSSKSHSNIKSKILISSTLNNPRLSKITDQKNRNIYYDDKSKTILSNSILSLSKTPYDDKNEPNLKSQYFKSEKNMDSVNVSNAKIPNVTTHDQNTIIISDKNSANAGDSSNETAILKNLTGNENHSKSYKAQKYISDETEYSLKANIKNNYNSAHFSHKQGQNDYTRTNDISNDGEILCKINNGETICSTFLNFNSLSNVENDRLTSPISRTISKSLIENFSTNNHDTNDYTNKIVNSSEPNTTMKIIDSMTNSENKPDRTIRISDLPFWKDIENPKDRYNYDYENKQEENRNINNLYDEIMKNSTNRGDKIIYKFDNENERAEIADAFMSENNNAQTVNYSDDYDNDNEFIMLSELLENNDFDNI